MRCCVSSCNNTSENTSQSDCITFHSFPSEVHLRAAWLRALGKQDSHLPDSSVVCSQHFLNDDIYETECGLRQIVTGAIPSTVQVCMICLDTDSKLILMSKHKLEETFEKLTGHPLCDRVKLKPTLCVQCAQRLINFRKFRDKSLRARALMMDLIEKHKLITRQHIKMINRTKHQLKSSMVLTTLGPDHCDLHILEHPSEDKLEEFEEIKPSDVVKTEVSDDSMLVDGDMEVKYEEDNYVNEFVQDPLKNESAPLQCTLCLEGFIDENVYKGHIKSVHLQNGDGDGECDTSEVCKPHTAVSSSSSHSSLITENKQADPSPSAHASSQNEVPKTEYIIPVTNITLQDTTYCFNNVSNKQYYNNSLQNSLHTEKISLVCEICQKIFKQKSHLAKHTEAHGIIQLFPCALCEYKSNCKRNLLLHMKTHTGEKRYICKICTKKYASIVTLVRHMRTHTGENLFICKICNKKYVQNYYLKRHMRTHTGEKPFSCKLCEYKCLEKWNLVKHMRTHTGDSHSQRDNFSQSGSQTGNISLICDTCGKMYKRKDQLVTHIQAHSGIKLFPCTLCDYKCNLKGTLVVHMRTHTGEKPYACNLCEYKCAIKCSLNTHMRTHTGEKSYACRICDTKFSHNGSLVRHMRTHTGEKPFACKLCEFTCVQESILARHRRKHTGEKPYSCTICEYKCSDKGNLDRHIRTHTGEKPYICSICDKKFARKYYLEMHMKTHSGIKPYSCNICKHKCATERHLENHMKTHTGEKPFNCNICNARFTWNTDLVCHMRTHTGEKPYQCTFCEYKSAQSSTLTKHLRTHTGEKPYICKICNKTFARNSHLFKHMKTHSKADVHNTA